MTDLDSPIKDEEVAAVHRIFQTYGRPLGPSGVLLATGVVTEENERRVVTVMDAMEDRGLLVVKYAAAGEDGEDIYELADRGAGT